MKNESMKEIKNRKEINRISNTQIRTTLLDSALYHYRYFFWPFN